MSGIIPQTQALPANSDSKLFNITSFGGVNYAENPFITSASTASEMKNLYVNDEGTLVTRPRLHLAKDMSSVLKNVQQALEISGTKYIVEGKVVKYAILNKDVDHWKILVVADTGESWYIQPTEMDLGDEATMFTGYDSEQKTTLFVTSSNGLFEVNDGYELVAIQSKPKTRRVYKSTDSVGEYTQENDENLLSTGYIDKAFFNPAVNYIDRRFDSLNIKWDVSSSFNITEIDKISIENAEDYKLIGKKNNDYTLWVNNAGFVLAIQNGKLEIDYNSIAYAGRYPISLYGSYAQDNYIERVLGNKQLNIRYKDEIIHSIDLGGYRALHCDSIDVENSMLYIHVILKDDTNNSEYSVIYKCDYYIDANNKLTVQHKEIARLPRVVTLTEYYDMFYCSLMVDENNVVYFLDLWNDDLYYVDSEFELVLLKESMDLPLYVSTPSDNQYLTIYEDVYDIKNGKFYIWYSDKLRVYDLSTGEYKDHSEEYFSTGSVVGYDNNSVVMIPNIIDDKTFKYTFLGEVTKSTSITTTSKTHTVKLINIPKKIPYYHSLVSTSTGVAYLYCWYDTGCYITKIEYKDEALVEPNLSETIEYDSSELYSHKLPYVYKFDDKLWFYGSEDNIVRYTNDYTASFLPKNNYDDIGDGSPITGLVQVSDAYLAIFKENEAFLITEDSETSDLYYIMNLKTKLGNVAQNQAIVTGLSNQPLVINDYGVYALGQSSNSIDTDTVFTSVSEKINPKFVLIKNKDKIKTHNHRFLTYFYYPLTDKETAMWVYDNRNGEWYYWEIPIQVATMLDITDKDDDYDERLTWLFTPEGKIYHLTSSMFYHTDPNNASGQSDILTYQDYISVEQGQHKFKRIDWYWKSQPLTLNAINYLKKLNEVGLIFADRDRSLREDAITKTNINGAVDSNDNLQLLYRFKTYRKKSRLLNSSYSNSIDYLINARIKPRTQKFDFIELELTNSLTDSNDNTTYTYTGVVDSDEEYNNGGDILDKLNLIGITFKYTLSSGA